MKSIHFSELKAAQSMVADHGLWVSFVEHGQTLAANHVPSDKPEHPAVSAPASIAPIAQI